MFIAIWSLLWHRFAQKALIMRRNKPGSIYFKSTLGIPLLCILANITPNLSIMLKLSIPIINSSNRRFCLKHLCRNPLIALLNRLIHLFLFNSKMTFSKSSRIISRIPMFLYLVLRPSHYSSNSVDQPLILSLHIISFEVRHAIVLIRRCPRRLSPSGFDHRFHIP